MRVASSPLGGGAENEVENKKSAHVFWTCALGVYVFWGADNMAKILETKEITRQYFVLPPSLLKRETSSVATRQLPQSGKHAVLRT
jgi:hypothetical protein